MNIKEFGKWPPYNRDNPQYSGDEYNPTFIKERFDCPDEYSGSDFNEYYGVPRMYEAPYEKQDKSEPADKDKKDKNTRQLRQNMLRQVVGLVAGSVVITTSYQAAVQQRQAQAQEVNPPYEQTQTITPEQEEPAEEPLVLSPSWKWSDDYQTVTLELLDADGNRIREIPATVSVSDVEATCVAEGERTYTATAEDDGNDYSDSRSETLPPLGHAFDDGKEIVLENGQSAMTFECNRCHEHFTIETSMTENE